MNAVLAGYQAISILRGGPLAQLRGTARHLPAHGVTPRLFDPWSPFGATDADVLHIFAANIGTYHLAREIRDLGIPLLVSPIIYRRHGAGFIRRSLRLTRAAQRLGPGIWSDYAITADICSWAARVLPNTRAEARLLEEGLGVPAERIVVVPNGVDERFAHGDPALFRGRYGLSNFILTVGHTGHRRKNVLALIRALAGIDHPAVIIGRIIRGAYGDACVREAAKHPHILLIDGLPGDSDMLASAYAACDVFVLPSLFETPGIAALEAGLAGAKVVITKHGGTTEYFGEMARYVEPSSVEDIRRGIREALDAAPDDRLRGHIRERYLWGEVARMTAAVYAGVLADRRTGWE
jgi:glycosyltransferase involved in cell wall biosynthesis